MLGAAILAASLAVVGLTATPAHAAEHGVASYAELVTAAANAVAGDVIVLTADIELDATVTFPVAVTVRGSAPTITVTPGSVGMTMFQPVPSAVGAAYAFENFRADAAGAHARFLEASSTGGGTLSELRLAGLEVADFTGDSPLVLAGIETASVVIRDSTFRDYHCVSGTCLMLRFEHVPAVEVHDSTFDDNTTDAPQGAQLAVSHGGTLEVSGVEMRNGLSEGGGAILAADLTGAVTIEDSTFDGNTNDGSGGAITAVNLTSLAVARSVFSSGWALHSGGALAISGGAAVTIDDSTFSENASGSTSGGHGGAIFVEIVGPTTPLTVRGSTFAGNGLTQAAANGTSMYVKEVVSGGVFTLSDSTVHHPSSSRAGVDVGSVLAGGEVRVDRSTLTGGSGLRVANNAGETLIDHSVFDGRTPTVEVLAARPIAATWSHFSDTPGGVTFADSLTDRSANLAALADNGGPTQTRMPRSGSPVINAGDPALSIARTVDQRGVGFSRVVGGRVDLGAVESSWVPTAASPADELPPTGAALGGVAPAAAGALVLAAFGAGMFAFSRRRCAAAGR